MTSTQGRLSSLFVSSPMEEALLEHDEAFILLAEVAKVPAVELPLEELQRAEEITHPESRRRYFAGRSLVRGTISRWTGMPPHEIAIALAPEGKPYLSQQGMPHFSISHTGEMIAVAFSHTLVGIDLEQERPLDSSALAQRFFSPEEADALEESGSLHDFFQLWSCREAAIKGDGRGLSALLASTRVHLPYGEGAEEIIQVEIGDQNWSVIPWDLGDKIQAAVAFKKIPRVIRWCDLR